MADKPTQQAQDQQKEHERDVVEDLDVEQQDAEQVKGGVGKTLRWSGPGDEGPEE